MDDFFCRLNCGAERFGSGGNVLRAFAGGTAFLKNRAGSFRPLTAALWTMANLALCKAKHGGS